MESIVKESEVKELGFPKLMISEKEVIVLFERIGSGTVLMGDKDFSIGHQSSGWYMNVFKDFHGEIILKN